MSIHAFFSVALMSSSALLDNGYFAALERPWATDLLADQNLGGAIGWAMGEVPILLALLATFIQWTKADKKETGRIDRAAERAAAMGEDDDLAKYNKYLAQLNRGDRTEKSD
jgi:putative copper resistance protein D